LKLEKFRVEGFRSLASTDWIPITKTTIFTGQNDGGKTSALDALALLLEKKAVPDRRDFTITQGDEAPAEKMTIEGNFNLAEDDRKELQTPSSQILIRREFNFSSGESSYVFKTMVHKDGRFRRNLSEVPINELTALASEFGIILSSKKLKDLVVKEIREWVSQQDLVEGWLALPRTLVDRMPEVKVFESADALNPEHEINSTLRNSFSARVRSEEYSGKLGEISQQIEKEMRQDLEILLPIIKKYCGDVSDVDIRPQFDYTSGFRTSRLLLRTAAGPPIDLDKEGEGRRRKITLAVYEWREQIFASEPTTGDPEQLILAFDEPDTHLDYLSQRKVFEIIKKIGQQARINIIVCTHSLNLIDRIPLTDVVHFELEAGKTRTNTIKSESPELNDLFMYQISDSMGLRNSVMLNERCFLVVEGLTEMGALPVLFTLRFGFSPQGGGVRIVNGEGGVGARLFSKFLNDHKRNVLFMVDNDTKTHGQGKYFSPDSMTADGIDLKTQVYFVGNKEFEDAFADEIYLRAAEMYWPKHDGSHWQMDEFSSLRAKADFSEEVMTLIRKSIKHPISKPDVGYHLAKSIRDPKEIPTQILNCIDQAFRLANSD